MSSFNARFFPGLLTKRNGAGAHNQDAEPIERLTLDGEGSAVPETEDTDEVLILRLQKNDVPALGLLYHRYARLVYSLCVRILRDPAEAEDLVHEVFLCLYRRCKSFDPSKGSARSWLIQLTYHRCFDWRDYLKARHGRAQGGNQEKVLVTLPEPMNNSDPASLVVSNPRMKAAFKSLSAEQRLTIRLHYFNGYTFAEIGKELGWSYDSVKHHVHRGIERLRRIVFDLPSLKTCNQTSAAMKCEAKVRAR